MLTGFHSGGWPKAFSLKGKQEAAAATLRIGRTFTVYLPGESRGRASRQNSEHWPYGFTPLSGGKVLTIPQLIGGPFYSKAEVLSYNTHDGQTWVLNG